ncbi:MAG: YlxR family protein [Ktedonobacteraceae bacterium]|nr:YlxR family protein [Ktedonobacteraceae bacterium]
MAATKKQQPRKQKHVPMRTCIACRETKSKRELLRVVRTPEGRVFLDATGKKSGRGAYLCARFSCWELALKKRRLEQELEVTIPAEDRANLENFVATLPRGETISP